MICVCPGRPRDYGKEGWRLKAIGLREKCVSGRAEIKTLEDLIIWQKAHEMELRIIELVTSFPVSLKPTTSELFFPTACSLKPIA
jgi:hypothetical protein